MTLVVLTSAKNGLAGIGTGPTGEGVGEDEALTVTEGVGEDVGEAGALTDGDGEGVGVGVGVGVGATSLARGNVITRLGTDPPRYPAPATSKVPKVTLALYSLNTFGRDLSNVLIVKSPSFASKSSAPALEATGPRSLAPPVGDG